MSIDKLEKPVVARLNSMAHGDRSVQTTVGGKGRSAISGERNRN